MRVYIAGMGDFVDHIHNFNLHKLFSILHEPRQIDRYLTEYPGHTLMVDSGAHSWNKTSINPLGLDHFSDNLPLAADAVKTYEEIVKERVGLNAIFVEFDVYGALPLRLLDESAQRIQVAMEGQPSEFMRVYHPVLDGGSLDILRLWIDKGYTYLGIGNDSISLLPQILSLTRDRVRLHGFALTKHHILQRYPLFSADSTSALAPAKFGGFTNERFTHQGRVKSIQRHRPELFRGKRARSLKALQAAGWVPRALHTTLAREGRPMARVAKKLPGAWVELPLSALVPAPWNYKGEDEKLADKLFHNIQRNGQVENLTVRELPEGVYEVVNGNHRLPVFKKAGIDPAMCYNCGPVDVEEAVAVALELNETRFPTDQVALSRRIEKLLPKFGQDDLKKTLPMPSQEFNRIVASSQFNWDNFKATKPMKEGAKGGSVSLAVDLSVPWFEKWQVLKGKLEEAYGERSDTEVFIALLEDNHAS